MYPTHRLHISAFISATYRHVTKLWLAVLSKGFGKGSSFSLVHRTPGKWKVFLPWESFHSPGHDIDRKVQMLWPWLLVIATWSLVKGWWEQAYGLLCHMSLFCGGQFLMSMLMKSWWAPWHFSLFLPWTEGPRWTWITKKLRKPPTGATEPREFIQFPMINGSNHTGDHQSFFSDGVTFPGRDIIGSVFLTRFWQNWQSSRDHYKPSKQERWHLVVLLLVSFRRSTKSNYVTN